MIMIDIEMPKCCARCPIFEETEQWGAMCSFSHKNNLKERTDRPSECPLKEIEKSDDCVNRRTVLYAIANDKLNYEALYEYVKQLPPVAPAENVGHWIDTGSGQECSECGEIQYGYDNFRNYCAYCGAKMEEVKE